MTTNDKTNVSNRKFRLSAIIAIVVAIVILIAVVYEVYLSTSASHNYVSRDPDQFYKYDYEDGPDAIYVAYIEKKDGNYYISVVDEGRIFIVNCSAPCNEVESTEILKGDKIGDSFEIDISGTLTKDVMEDVMAGKLQVYKDTRK